MASYDLKCEECGRTFELFVQGFLKDKDKVCPACGSRRVDQLFTGGFMMGGGSGSGSAGGAACAPGGHFG